MPLIDINNNSSPLARFAALLECAEDELRQIPGELITAANEPGSARAAYHRAFRALTRLAANLPAPRNRGR